MLDPAAAKEVRERHLTNLMGELSPLIPYLEKRELTNLYIYGDGRFTVDDFIDGRTETGITVAEDARYRIIHYLASMEDTPIDVWDNPTLEGILPRYNMRITAVVPPWVKSPEITLRRPAAEIFPLEKYLQEERMTGEQYEILVGSIRKKENILIGGGTGSGKTTFTNACMEKMREFTPHERFLIIEDTPELQCRAEDKTQLYIRKEQAPLAVQFALRWCPKRIIFGELRNGIVARELLEAWNTGHPGNLTTLHADSASSMLNRLRGMLSEVITGTIPDLGETIHLCVHLRYKETFGPVVDEVLPTGATGREKGPVPVTGLYRRYAGLRAEAIGL
jgi:type IV secretion system protein VirB11